MFRSQVLHWAAAGGLFAALFAGGFYFGKEYLHPSRPSAVLRIEPGDLNFWTVWPQRAYHHTLAVENTSHRNLRVIAVTTSCNCTRVEPQEFELAPGASQALDFTLDLSPSSSDDTDAAETPFAVEFSFRVADVAPFSDAWRLSGNIRRPIRFTPPRIVYGGSERLICGVDGGERRVVMRQAYDLGTLQAVCDADVGEVRIESSTDKVGTLALRFVPSHALTPGPVETTVKIFSSLNPGKNPVAELPIVGTAVAPVFALPETLTLGPIPVGEPRTAKVQFASQSGALFTLLDCAITQDSIVSSRTPAEPSSRCDVEVTIPSPQEGTNSGQLEAIVALGPQRYTLTVPVVYYGVSQE